MRIFLTGASGFVGRHTVAALLGAGYSVTALSRVPRVDGDVHWLAGAMSDDWRDELARCDGLVHLAAAGVVGAAAAADAFAANVAAPMALLHQAAQAGCRTWTLCGSSFEYGLEGERMNAIDVDCGLAPVGSYAVSKAAFSLLAMDFARQAGARTRLLRPFQVYGEGEASSRLWTSLRAAAQAGADFPMSPGEQVRDFVAVEDVADALAQACTWDSGAAPTAEIWHVGTGKPQMLLDFSRHWWTHWEAKGQLLPGALPYRDREIMRYVPSVDSLWVFRGSDAAPVSGGPLNA